MSVTESLNTFQQLAPVRVAAASNQSGTYVNGPINNGVGATFTYTAGTLTIDSVVVGLNDYVLLAAQTAAYQNGIYQCTSVGSAGFSAVLTRRGDFQCREQLVRGQYVPVSAGAVYGGSFWTLIEPLPAAIGNPAVSGANNIVFSSAQSSGDFLLSANNLSDVANATTSLSNLGGLPKAGGTMTGKLNLTTGTDTASAGVGTINAQSGILTTGDLTGVSPGTAITFTINSTYITSHTSVVVASVTNNTNTVLGVVLNVHPPSLGAVQIDVINNNAASNLNGTCNISFVVFN